MKEYRNWKTHKEESKGNQAGMIRIYIKNAPRRTKENREKEEEHIGKKDLTATNKGISEREISSAKNRRG